MYKVAPKRNRCAVREQGRPVEILGAQWAIMQLKAVFGVKIYSLMIITPEEFHPSNFFVSFII